MTVKKKDKTALLAAYLKRNGLTLVECQKALNLMCIKDGDFTREFVDTCNDAAVSRHCDGSDNEIETDGEGTLSVGDEGVWVSAWLFVPNADIGLGDEEEEELTPEQEATVLKAIEEFNKDPKAHCPRSDGSKIII